MKALVRHQLQRLARRAVEPREIKQLIQRLGHEDLELKLLCQRGKRVRIPLSVQKEENVSLIQKRVGIRKLRFQFLFQMPLPHVRVMVRLKINEGKGQRVEIRQVGAGRLYRFAVELPGFEKDEIHVDVQDGYLTVSAEKGLDKDEENKKGRVLRQERYSGACSRSFYVGDVKPEDVKAKYESGVLTVLIPKEEPKKLTSSSKIAIE